MPEVDHARNYSLTKIWIAGFFLKVLLFTTYHSTDFDVHRNWLAITSSLPLKDWYFESTSQWTLDYPPFFAYFEYFLSTLVPQVVKEDGCLEILEVGQYSFPTIAFQRLTVIGSEIWLFFMLQWYVNSTESHAKQRSFVVASSIALSPGFLIIDHIHFQYNGFLFGFIVGSIVAVRQQRYLLCGAFFAVALCFKHIFLYLAPAYFFFLLGSYGINKKAQAANPLTWFNIGSLVKLGSVVVSIFALAFGPFVYYNQIPQLLTRLFPFSRGLTHAYWAPNAWALYSFLDKILAQLCIHVPAFSNVMTWFGFSNLSKELILNKLAISSNTKGLVQDVSFTILPNVPPKATFVLTLFYQLQAVVPLLFAPSYASFLGALTLCGYASFLFGWHVHEKAIMLVIIPFSFLVVNDRRFLSGFLVLVSAGYTSLFPLLFTSELWLLKTLYTYVWCLIYFVSFRQVCRNSSSVSRRVFFIDRLAMAYVVGLIPLFVFCGVLDAMGDAAGILGKLEFFRLMCISVYCAFGVIGSWFALSWLYFFDSPLWENPV